MKSINFMKGKHNMTDKQFSDYCKEVSAAYWAEEDEFKMGIHPTQIKEKLITWFQENNYHIEEGDIFLDWKYSRPHVGVKINGEYFGRFDYDENTFIDTPDSRLSDEINAYDKREPMLD